jgi:hypothetical protein
LQAAACQRLHVDGLNHSDNMLVAYLPKEKILINADLYTLPAQGAAAPANVSPNAVALFFYQALTRGRTFAEAVGLAREETYASGRGEQLCRAIIYRPSGRHHTAHAIADQLFGHIRGE